MAGIQIHQLIENTKMTWEDTFKSWGAPPGTTEQEKMENTEAAVRKAIGANTRLADMDISIIPQGSYKSKTNVKNDSDVDICVCLNSTFFPRYPEGKTHKDYGNSTGSIIFSDFKNLANGCFSLYCRPHEITEFAPVGLGWNLV